MGKRIRRHVDPFQCRIALRPEAWLGRYRAHGEGEIWLDLGCGKGEFLAGLAALHPGIFFIGVEIRGKIAAAYFPRHRHLPNLALLHGNVNLSIPSFMGPCKARRVFIQFPDPYGHKARHEKRRMVNSAFVEGLCKILYPGGVASIKTDDRDLFDGMDALLSGRLEPIVPQRFLPEDVTVLSEWEMDCRKKSIPVFSRDYALR